jgi:hypothetical protein
VREEVLRKYQNNKNIEIPNRLYIYITIMHIHNPIEKLQLNSYNIKIASLTSLASLTSQEVHAIPL